MKKRLTMALAAAVLAVGSTTVAAAVEDVVKGGGDVLVPTTGVYGSVGVRVKVTADGVSGAVNLDLYDPETGARRQHFRGAVTDVRFAGDGVAYVCGTVTLLQLGTNTNEGRSFEIVVEDGGGTGSGGDRLGWYRQREATNCDDDAPAAGEILTSGNLKVID